MVHVPRQSFQLPLSCRVNCDQDCHQPEHFHTLLQHVFLWHAESVVGPDSCTDEAESFGYGACELEEQLEIMACRDSFQLHIHRAKLQKCFRRRHCNRMADISELAEHEGTKGGRREAKSTASVALVHCRYCRHLMGQRPSVSIEKVLSIATLGPLPRPGPTVSDHTPSPEEKNSVMGTRVSRQHQKLLGSKTFRY